MVRDLENLTATHFVLIINSNKYICPQLPLDLSVRKSSVGDDVTSGDDNDVVTSDSPPPLNDASGLIADTAVSPCVTRHEGEVGVSLLDAHIWEAFSLNGTEMIINRNGRYRFHV